MLSVQDVMGMRYKFFVSVIPGADPGGGPGARAPPSTLGFEAQN